jgi:hypothetical protein
MARSLLMRVGAVLVVVGLVDIAVMVYSIANRMSYSSSFNVIAVAAGIFLLRGSLRAASLIRWLAVLILACILAGQIVWPLLQPLDLTITQLRLAPAAFLPAIGVTTLAICLLLWVSWELGREPIQAAIANAGIKRRDMRIPAATGAGLVLAAGIVLLAFLRTSDDSEHARVMAEQQAGANYHFNVRALNVFKSNQGRVISALVIAWNDKEIKVVPVRWVEH